MSKMIQVRNVSNRLHKELVRRARAEGLTLSGYIEEILEREASRPPSAEVFERIRSNPKSKMRSAAFLIRQDREGNRD